jgi:hypothetical protein
MMAKIFSSALVVLFTLVACGGTSDPAGAASPTGGGSCSPADCGPEPPIAPSACPPAKNISSVCERGADGKCARRIQCEDKH